MPATAIQYESVIGMEVHVELNTATKNFCACRLDAHAAPNTCVCPVCLGMPGSLPVLNAKAVEKTLSICLALQCAINSPCHFERKNYYYPDLPKNYQISQNARPLGINGVLDLVLPEGGAKRVGINNVHLEEDAGKNMHLSEPGKGDFSLVDLNRAGTPLVEIVSEPDLRGAAEAEAYMKTLRNLLLYLDVSDGKMQEGSIRFEVNISLRPVGTEKFGTKVEIKNLNSIRVALKCIAYEELRQAELLNEGGRVLQETRLWDEEAGVTRAMRSKETANDYRYFPDPDLVELELSADDIARSREALPELQAAKRARFVTQFGLPEYDAVVLTNDLAMGKYFERAVGLHNNPKAIGNWMMTEILREANKVGEDFDIDAFPVQASALAKLVQLIDTNVISGKIAKTVFPAMVAGEHGGDPEAIVNAKGLQVVADTGALEAFCREAIAANPEAVADIKAGKKKAIGRLVGDVMKKSGGKASPDVVNKLLESLIG